MEQLNFKLDTSSLANPYVSDMMQGGKTIAISFPDGQMSAIFIQQSTDGLEWRSKQSVSATKSATINVSADSNTYLRVRVSIRPMSASYKDYSGGGGGGTGTEVDPTVPSWAKRPQKPTYTPQEIGAASQSELSKLTTELEGKASTEQLSELAAELETKASKEQLSELSLKVGDLNELDESVASDNLVDAINKAAQQGGGGAGGDCTITITATTTEGATTEGLSVTVIINDDIDNIQTLTTNAEGKATLTVAVGSKISINFPYQDDFERLPEIVRYAITKDMEIIGKYVAEATRFEQFQMHVTKWTGFTSEAYANCPVHITINGVTTDYTTDENGDFSLVLPYGTVYTVGLDNIEGFHLYGDPQTRNEITYTAESPLRNKQVNYHDIRIGTLLVCADGAEYYKDEFEASGRPKSDVVMFKFVTSDLYTRNEEAPNGNIFGVLLDDVTEATYDLSHNKKPWASSQVQFSSCTNSQSWNGYNRTIKIINEGLEKNIDTPAAAWAMEHQAYIGGTALSGFLGAVKQWLVLMDNRVPLDELLDYVRPGTQKHFADMLNNDSLLFWTIDQNSSASTYNVGTKVDYNRKTSPYPVLPFYAF